MVLIVGRSWELQNKLGAESDYIRILAGVIRELVTMYKVSPGLYIPKQGTQGVALSLLCGPLT